MRTAIYGGNFDPPHLGHVEAARTVSRCASPDRFLVIPDNISPHKETEEDSPEPRSRLELCRVAFREIPGVQVSDMELARDGRSYTAETVLELREQFPEDEFLLVVGSDAFAKIEQWYKFSTLVENCIFTVVARHSGDEPEAEEHAELLRREYGARVEILPHEPLEISSSTVRERLRLRLGAELLDDEVYSLIIRNRWYSALPELTWLREKATELLDTRRIAHVSGCEGEAVLLARRYGENPESAAVAAILHDITKKLPFEEQLALCEKYGIKNEEAELAAPKLLHAKTGAALAQDRFGVSDEIRDAIRWHTTGKCDMTLLEKIVYLADYIEPTRDFPGVEKLRELAYENIDKALALGLEMSIAEIRADGREPYKDTLDACLWMNCR